MALLNEINVKGVPHPIVTDDGYYEEMTVGDAEQLIATQFVEDNEPYLFRPTGGPSDVGNRAYIDKIVGGTVAWNQLADVLPNETRNGIVYSNDNGKISITGTVQGAPTYGQFTLTEELKFKRDGCKYLILLSQTLDVGVSGYGHASRNAFFFSDTGGTDWDGYVFLYVEEGETVSVSNLSLNVFDLTQMFGSTIADYIYSLEQSQAGAGVAWFKKLFPKDYYEYNAGELLSVEGLQSHDTVGFNQWDEEWEVGSYGSDGLPIASDDKIRTKNRISVQPSTAYYFKNGESGNLTIFWYDDNDTVISYESTNNSVKTSPANAKYLRFRTNNYGTTYKNDICINLSDPSRNGEYEPYEKHSYPLDSSLTLRGIPKLDASNNLYYDGDEYTSDGKVKRKYGVVDLGTFNWDTFTYGEATVFRSYNYTGKKPSGNTYVANIICSDYESVSANDLYSLNKDKAIAVHNGLVGLMVNDSTYTDAATFKEAMSGVMLVYELATPTTETAEPFQNIQVVDDFGTEEFVSTGIVPVGHKTRYPANLRDKLQHLPSLASADGTYLIQQSGKQMSLVHMPAVFPDIPTEDGTYVLKATVSSGTPTYVWEGVNAESGGE